MVTNGTCSDALPKTNNEKLVPHFRQIFGLKERTKRRTLLLCSEVFLLTLFAVTVDTALSVGGGRTQGRAIKKKQRYDNNSFDGA